MTSPRHPLTDILDHVPVLASIGSDLTGEAFQAFEAFDLLQRNARYAPVDNADHRTNRVGECVVISFEAVKRHRVSNAAGKAKEAVGGRSADLVNADSRTLLPVPFRRAGGPA